jgi:single-stranded-DNA-specific exonuclease
MSVHEVHTERRSLTGALWALVEVDEGRVSQLAGATGLSMPAARCLASRFDGDTLPSDDLLRPSLEHLHDPLGMRNMEAALDRLGHALARGERVRVVTDYDVDGTTSSLLLQAALRLRNPDLPLDYHIPNRFEEGYGFSVQAAKKAADDGVGLIVTADIGVRDHAAVAEARARGVDVLVCDHHLPAGASVPDDAIVLCPPQQGCAYPNAALAACGVSLKLAQGLLQHHHKAWDRILLSLLKLAAVGTVADMVPLNTLENRAIVTLGLQQLNEGRHHAGLTSLLKIAGLEERSVRTTDLGFRIGPRINAAGRVADAKLVVELLNTRDPDRAHELSQQLESLNTSRRDIQRSLVKEALAQLPDPPPPWVLLAGEEDAGWHRGVVGIVAARVKDEVHRPTAIASIQGNRAVGSVRSLPGVHAVRALDSAADLLVKYGGHPMAAGFTVPLEHLEALKQRLCDYVEAHHDTDTLVPRRRIDAVVSPDRLGEGLHQDLARLGPYGQANPRPLLMVPGVRVKGARLLGRDQQMLKLFVPRDGGGSVEAIWWGGHEHLHALQERPHDLLGHLGVNEWRGRRTLQLELKDARRSD